MNKTEAETFALNIVILFFAVVGMVTIGHPAIIVPGAIALIALVLIRWSHAEHTYWETERPS